MSKGKYDVKIIKAAEPIQKAEHPTQINPEEEHAASEWIPHNIEMRGLEQLVENSSILPQCIRAYRGNIAGYGIGVEYIDDEEENSEKAEEFERAETIIRRLNADKDIGEVFADIIEARETYGIAYAEVIRTLEGEVVQIEFIEDTISIETTAPLDPYVDVEYFDRGEKVERKKRFRKYKQQIGGKTVYFKEFGDPRKMDKRSGEYVDGNEELEIEYEANEILAFPIGTKAYGKVRWLGQVLGVDGSRRAEVLNNNYFKNGRHTPMMIVVRGGTLTDESFDKLTQYMNDIKGENGQHAFIILETENTDSRADFDAVQQPNIEIKDMANMLQKDELFQGYLDNNRRRVQSAFLLPDIYVGYSTDYNRATAQTAQEVTEQQVFQPERKSLAWIVNNKLLNGYNFKHVRAFFRGPDLNNPDDLARVLNICSAAGGLTPNKAKEILFNALGEVSEDYEGDWANQPIQLAGAQQSAPTEDVGEQLDKQIEKAAGAHEDEIVAVLKEVRNFLKSSNKGLTKPHEGAIIKADDGLKWITTKDGIHLPIGEDGSILSADEARNLSCRQELAKALESGKVKTKLDKVKQGEHVKGNPKYEGRVSKGGNPSYLTIKKGFVQGVVNEYCLTGEVFLDSAGRFQELVVCDREIGMCVDPNTKQEISTNRAIIHYSETGTHIVPTLRRTYKEAHP